MNLLQRLQITAAVREDWYLAMSSAIRAGKPVEQTLQQLEKSWTLTKHPMLPLLHELLRRLRGGSRPGAPANRNIGTELQGLVPTMEQLLISAGTQTGDIAGGFENAADYLKDMSDLKDSMISGLTQPVIYVIMALGVLFYFSKSIYPAFEKNKPRNLWPADAQLLANIGDYSGLVSILVIGGLIGSALALAYIIPNWIGEKREFADRKIFPFTLIAAVQGAGFLTALKGYMKSGIPFSDALTSVAANSSPYVKSQCTTALSYFRTGKTPEQCIARLSLVPLKYHWLIDVYGGSADVAKSYELIADQMMKRVKVFIDVFFKRGVGLSMMVLIGGYIFWAYTSLLGIADPSGSKRAGVPDAILSVSPAAYS